MARNVSVVLDQFGQEGLDRLRETVGGSPDTVFRTATVYYLSDRDCGRPAWRSPRFTARAQERGEVEVGLDERTWDELAEEADRQRVSPEELAAHALLYFLADVESGRATTRLKDHLDD